MFFTFFDLHKWYQIAQNISIDSHSKSIDRFANDWNTALKQMDMPEIKIIWGCHCVYIFNFDPIWDYISSSILMPNLWKSDEVEHSEGSHRCLHRFLKSFLYGILADYFCSISSITHKSPLYSQRWSVLRKQLAAYSLSYIELLKL